MKKMNVLSLMISCPSDVSDEVKTIEDVVRTINNTIGLSAGFAIRTLFWKECVIPTAGKSAQDIINEQVLSRADAVIAVFGNKIGSKTEHYDSGTIEEIEETIKANKQVFVYFSNKSIRRDELDQIDQIEDVEKFKEKYSNKGIYWLYKSNSEFKNYVQSHLSGYVANLIMHELPIEVQKSEKKIGHEINLPDKIYSNITKAHEDIANDIKNGKIIKFYGLRGATFVGPSEVNALVNAINENDQIETKFLISYPYSENIRDRLTSMDKYLEDDKCEKKWRNTYKKVFELVNQYARKENAEVRFHDTVLLFRLLFTRKHLYIGYYEPGKDSVNTCIFRFEQNSATYQTYEHFFDMQWKKAKRSIPKRIPAKYSFLKERFSMAPSLVINLSSECNMRCVYCPEGGENLCEINKSEQISDASIKRLIHSFKDHMSKDKEMAVLRITGGEPLLSAENRKTVATILTEAKNYNKIVLCTNGVFLSEAYEEYREQWDHVKNILLLKISLDTLNKERFAAITGTGKYGADLYDKVINNIILAKKKGFKIELNMVATKTNLESMQDVIDVFEFARINELVGLKVLTVNDFGGSVGYGQNLDDQKYISCLLNNVIEEMEKREYEERKVYLNDNKGIQMRRFVSISSKDKECTLTIVDHHSTSGSITPRRTFSEFCEPCKYFPDSDSVKRGLNSPCATGMMSLTLRADGVLSPCRLCTENGINIKNFNQRRMQKCVDELLTAYDMCFHKTIVGE